ncbi:hypothetical protein [Polaribacter porphyrae]|uniref:hypothetical protein n=1 Tax=Polaribacter porphyrae TaxID=1137780 RepID=UPI001B807985|nr:hypothetical protein [Polaribacter porphyrae]
MENNLETDKKVLKYFDQVFRFYLSVLTEYFQRTLPIAKIENGLSSEKGGRYEQIGYTKRTFEYLEYLCFLLELDFHSDSFEQEAGKKVLTSVINSNSVSCRPLVDINSIPIADILILYIKFGDKLSAKNYLKGVLSYVIAGKQEYGRMPDANNSYKSVIRYTVTGKKPVYYSDDTSPLLAMLLEFIVMLDLREEYGTLKSFVKENKINLGIFTPHHGIDSSSKHLIEEKNKDLEEQIFSNPWFKDGYQRNVSFDKLLTKELSFEGFKKEYLTRKNEFSYEYRTDSAGYPFLKSLAHIYNRIPYFPDKWRNII